MDLALLGWGPPFDAHFEESFAAKGYSGGILGFFEDTLFTSFKSYFTFNLRFTRTFSIWLLEKQVLGRVDSARKSRKRLESLIHFTRKRIWHALLTPVIIKTHAGFNTNNRLWIF